MATSLLDWIMDLMRTGDAREAFDANPQAAMASAGFTNICGEDIADSRAFLFDNPNIKEVGGVDRKVFKDDDDAPDQIKYIVNNYTFEAPAGPQGVPGEPGEPGDDGPEFGDIEDLDDSTVNDQSTTTDESTETEIDKSTENETEGETEAANTGIGNDTEGSREAGEDLLEESTANESTNTLGDGLITLNDTIDAGNLEVLSHLVEDNLNESLNDVLNESLNDSLNNILVGPLL